MKKITMYLSVLLLMGTIANAVPKDEASQPPNNDSYTAILKKHVNSSGWVNYKALKADRAPLDNYLKLLSASSPAANWSVNQKKAYWINVYNAFTLKLIIDNYPVKSIKDIGPAIQIPFVNTPWQKNFFKIGGKTMNLDDVEHNILRKDFNDPRIHFSLVCASRSCPKLRNEAYESDKIEAQLDDQGRDFLSDKSKNKITASNPEVSKIFSWFKGDFTKKSSLVDFINRFAPVKINKNADINYMDYSWKLNEQ